MEKQGKTSNAMFESLLAVGAHFGYSRSRRHPSVKPFLFGTKEKNDIIDLEHTSAQLETAKALVAEIAGKGGQVLFVGTKPEAKEAVKTGAQAAGAPYVSERWLGGILTNFREIRKRVNRMETILRQKEKGELSVYTKKERLLMDREVANLELYFRGIANMNEMPKAMFVVDPKKEEIAVLEARKKKIPVIALASSDCNIRSIEYPIVANDASLQSVSFFVNALADAYRGAFVKKGEPEKTA